MNAGVIAAIKRLTNVHIPSKNAGKDVFLFSSARSGSTYLMDLVLTQPGFKSCAEPLNLRRPPICRELGIQDWREMMPGTERNRKILEYFARIRENRVPYLNRSPWKRDYRFWTSRMVFKVLHGAEDMIEDIRQHFDAHAVYLLRHPIPVTLSREEFPRLNYFFGSEYFRRHFNPETWSRILYVRDRGSDFEKGIACWCFENYPALVSPDRNKWLTVHYENLVLKPESMVPKLCAFLDLPDEQRMMDKIGRPSATVSKSDSETRKAFESKAGVGDRSKWLIGKWRKKIDPAMEKAAFEILGLFGISCYRPGHDMPCEKPEQPA